MATETLSVLLSANAAGFTRGMKQAASATDTAAKSIQKASQSFTSLGSRLTAVQAAVTAFGGIMVREASKYDASVNSAVKNLQGAYSGLAVEVGRALVPAVNALSGFLDRLTAAWRGLSPEAKQAIIDYGEMALKIGAIVVVGGKIAGIATSVAGLASAFLPILPVVAGIGVALGAVVVLLGTMARIADGEIPALGDGFRKVAEDVMGLADSVKTFMKYVVAYTIDSMQTLTNWLLEGFAGILDAIGMSGSVLRAVKLPTVSGLMGDKEGGSATRKFADQVEKSFDKGASLISGALMNVLGEFGSLFKKGGKVPRYTPLDSGFKNDETDNSAFFKEMFQEQEEKVKSLLKSSQDAWDEIDKKDSELREEMLKAYENNIKAWNELGTGSATGFLGTSLSAKMGRDLDTKFAKFLTDMFGQVSGSMGQTGSVLESTFQGAQTAGPWGALAGAAVALLTQAEGFTGFMAVVNASTQDLANAIGSFMKPMQTFAGGMHMLGNVVNRVVSPIMEALGDIFGDLGGFLALLSYVVEPVVPIIKIVSQLFSVGLKPALETMFWSIKPFILAALGGGKVIIEAARIFFVAITAVSWELGMMAETIAAGAGKAFFDFAFTVDQQFVGPLRAASDNMSTAIDDVVGMTLGEARAKADNTAQTITNTEKMKGLAEAMTNVPTGYKVRGAQFGADSGLQQNTSGVPEVNVNIVLDPAGIVKEVVTSAQRGSFRNSGSKYASGLDAGLYGGF